MTSLFKQRRKKPHPSVDKTGGEATIGTNASVDSGEHLETYVHHDSYNPKAASEEKQADRRFQECQAHRSSRDSILRWKLVSAWTIIILAVANWHGWTLFQILPTFIPVLTGICDLAARDYELRIALGTSYLYYHGDNYERWIRQPFFKTHSFTRLGDIAMIGGSLLLNVLVLCAGLWRWMEHDNSSFGQAYFVSGLIGSVVIVWVHHYYYSYYRQVFSGEYPLNDVMG